MATWIERVQINGLHGWLDYSVDFAEGINVFYGRNGSGKTTMLHVISNLLGGDIARFLSIRFDTISMSMSDGNIVLLKQSLKERTNWWEVECVLNDQSLGTINQQQTRRPSTGELREAYVEMVSRLQSAIGLKPTYFPAFRSILELTAQFERGGMESDAYYLAQRAARLHRTSTIGESNSMRTRSLRELFGGFTPDVKFPSLQDVETRVDSEVGAALFKVATANRQLFSRTFLNSLDAVTRESERYEGQPEQLLGEIDELLKQLDEPVIESRTTYGALAERVNELKTNLSAEHTNETVNDILVVYKNALEERLKAQREAFDRLDQLLVSANSFLEQKQLDIVRLPEDATKAGVTREYSGRFVVRLDSGVRESPSKVLSSGERQIVCLIYAASRLEGEDTVVLVDEPELSLNIDWQRRLLTEMQAQMGYKQIIVCTHSPDIGGDHEDAVRVLRPVVRKSTSPATIAGADQPAPSDDDDDTDLPF